MQFVLPVKYPMVTRFFILALVYFSAGWLGLKIPFIGSHITLAWLPALRTLYDKHIGATLRLAVTDTGPGMSGLDVAREVRAIRMDLPVVVASGFVDETLQAQAKAAGVLEVIFKAEAMESFCEVILRRLAGVGDASKSP